MLEELVKDIDIPTRNILAHLFVNAKTAAAMEKQMGWADLKRGLLAPRAQCSHSNQTFYFFCINPFSPRLLRGRRPTRLNRTGAVAVPNAASAVPAILAEGSLPSAAEVAVAVLAEFKRKAEETRELHASSPGAGEGNCRRFQVVVIDTSLSDLTVSAVLGMRCLFSQSSSAAWAFAA